MTGPAEVARLRDALEEVEAALCAMGEGPAHGEAEVALLGLVINDRSTGLRNRRGLEQALRSEWRRAARRDEALGLVLIELAAVPDDPGLALVGAALGWRDVRSEDTVARIGPATFAALLPACDREGAAEVARRLVASLSGAGVPEPARVGHASMRPACGGRPEELMAAALR